MVRLVTVVVLFSISLMSWSYDQKNLNEEVVIAANWQQLSGEFDAYIYQTFNGAREQLEQALKSVPPGMKPAIISDIDDTLLSGITYFTSFRGTQESRDIDRSIYWWNNQPTFALPGTVDFFRRVQQLGIEIFYISGRFNDVKTATFQKLKEFGFPVVSEDFILLQEKNNLTVSKEEKRQWIRDQNYHVIMLFGDQLDDLNEIKTPLSAGKKQWVNQQAHQFGKEWFILPNTVYGAWEESTAPNYLKMNPADKHNARMRSLKYKRTYQNTRDKEYVQHLLLADVWYQTSADFHATAYQAFNQAERSLRTIDRSTLENPVIIVDIDGTILNFLPIYATPIAQDNPGGNQRVEFLNEQQHAEPIPGSLKFLKNARQQGYDIFYVTNRPASTGQKNAPGDIKLATIATLRKHQFPMADEKHVLLQGEFCPEGKATCGKEFRRRAIINGIADGTKHEAVLFVGDMLGDFDLIENNLDPLDKSSVTATKDLYGKQYIIIPNPVNTAWMRARYSQSAGTDIRNLTMSEQAEFRRSLMPDWDRKNDYKTASIASPDIVPPDIVPPDNGERVSGKNPH